MRIIPLLLIVVGGCTVTYTSNEQLSLGDGRIDGRKIRPYELNWHQCSVADGQWIDNGLLTEQVAVIGPDILRLAQITKRANGPTTVATTYFDRESFGPLRMEFMAILPDGTRKPLAVQELDADGYTGWSALTGAAKPVQGKITSSMVHGVAMGLPLATVRMQKSPLEFTASMMSFDATYRVIAKWVGNETLEYMGNDIQARLVDVEWHHLESGDVYPPGPDASGGRYWIVSEPPDGFPYVPRYQTDTYTIEFIQKTCPTTLIEQ